MGGNDMASNNGRQHHAPREFFTLGEHAIPGKHYRFRYDGKVYRILERPVNANEEEEAEESLVLEEADSRKAYDAWNRIKRPERFGL